jgi:TonB family protein
MFKKCLIISAMFHILLIVGAGLSLSRPPALIKPAYFQLVSASAAGTGSQNSQKQKTSPTFITTLSDKHQNTISSSVAGKPWTGEFSQQETKQEAILKTQNVESTSYLSQARNNEQPGFGTGDSSGNNSGPGRTGGGGNPDRNYSAVSGDGSSGEGDGDGNIQGGTVKAPLKSYNLKPYYPQTAKEKGWQGTVILEATLDKKGRVGEIRKIQSSGFPLLDEEAIKAVKKWRYQPATQDGKPIEWRVRVKYVFKLEE